MTISIILYLFLDDFNACECNSLGPFFLEPNVAKLMAGFESFEGAFKSAWYTSCFARTDSHSPRHTLCRYMLLGPERIKKSE